MEDLEAMVKFWNMRSIGTLRNLAIGMAMVVGWVGPASAQVPGLPGSAKPASSPKPDPSVKPIPAKDSPGAVFSATSGPIHVDQKVDDIDIRATLDDLLNQYFVSG